MATEYLTNDIELTSVADAIRAKSGQTGQLIYPDGFASAVAGIKKAPTTPYMVAEYEQVPVTANESASYIKKQSSTIIQELQLLSLRNNTYCKSWICQIHQTTLQRLMRTLCWLYVRECYHPGTVTLIGNGAFSSANIGTMICRGV